MARKKIETVSPNEGFEKHVQKLGFKDVRDFCKSLPEYWSWRIPGWLSRKKIPQSFLDTFMDAVGASEEELESWGFSFNVRKRCSRDVLQPSWNADISAFCGALAAAKVKNITPTRLAEAAGILGILGGREATDAQKTAFVALLIAWQK